MGKSMTLQEQIKKDLMAAMKAKDETQKSSLRVVMGEFGRMQSKTLTDDEVISVIKKLIKAEKEVLAQKNDDTSPFIETIEHYLPQMVSDAEVKAWIAANIDFSQHKNKMQAMGSIMKHFGATADGNRVKAILQAL
jgi:uncharacterized protein YqeY